ncbi:MAG: single-stranded-DNA-specific exonuclease RecJ [Clostridia bacterium]|nr:single-stranded-DNA-specific exonuclease RecJ [Clostridia bacterium]
MNRKKWIVSECNRDIAAEIAENCGVDPFAAYLLVARGLTDEFLVESFLYDTDILDPFLLPDMEKACERIKSAIENGEKITVFGDYDADGVTSTALLYSYLSKNGANVDYYIPDRAGEGYGMNIDAVESLKERGTSLIITVDNGISAIEEIEKAKELSIDVVVTDHHQCGEILPDAVAVVDPHRKDCDIEFREWAGVGVAFKLVSALADCDVYDLLDEYGDILAIGTIADIVSLKGENRILVRSGLSVLNDAYQSGTLRKGLEALIDESGTNKNMTSMSAAFRIAPRINAAGRMGSANRAIKLLLTDDVEEATLLASEIGSANSERQSTESGITESAEKYIEEHPEIKFARVIVVDGEEWHQGVIGIVASRLCEKYGKPCIVISKSGDVAKGSGRSVEGFSLYDALYYCKDILVQYGGHKLAAGLTVETKNIDEFRALVNEYAEKSEQVTPMLKIDCKLNPASVSLDLLSSISVLEPFGAENPQPLFGLFGMKITGIQPVGSNKHIRLTVNKNGVNLPVMLFSVAPEDFPYCVSDVVDLAIRLSQNEYMGETKVSIQVKDIKLSLMDDDKVQKSLLLYESFIRGDSLTQEQKNILLTDREFCGNVYRFLRANNGFSGNEEILCSRLGLKEEKLATLKVALDMFIELQVIILQNGKYFLPAQQNKVVLENSVLYQSLLN